MLPDEVTKANKCAFASWLVVCRCEIKFGESGVHSDWICLLVRSVDSQFTVLDGGSASRCATMWFCCVVRELRGDCETLVGRCCPASVDFVFDQTALALVETTSRGGAAAR